MRIFIVGGTSGIGLALANFYHQKGCDVGVCGRNVEKISHNHTFKKYQADIIDKEALERALREFAGTQEVDLFINCAGSYAQDVTQSISYEQAQAMLQTNILGCVHCFEVASRQMRAQTSGQIVMMASVAGLLDYADASLYAKSKRSVIYIAKAYKRALSPFGIDVSVMVPGYIDTQKLRELNNNDLSQKPFLIDEQSAVEEITSAIMHKKPLHIFPKKMKYLMLFLSVFPSWLLKIIMYQKALWMGKNETTMRK